MRGLLLGSAAMRSSSCSRACVGVPYSGAGEREKQETLTVLALLQDIVKQQQIWERSGEVIDFRGRALFRAPQAGQCRKYLASPGRYRLTLQGACLEVGLPSGLGEGSGGLLASTCGRARSFASGRPPTPERKSRSRSGVSRCLPSPRLAGVGCGPTRNAQGPGTVCLAQRAQAQPAVRGHILAGGEPFAAFPRRELSLR